MKKFIILGMSAVLSVGAFTGCGDGAQNTSNTVRNSSSNAPMNSNMNSSSTMNSNMNSNMVSNANVNSNTALVQDNFWTNAAQGGMAEVELSKLALTKATNAEVKQFAQTMVADHTKANTELTALAGKKGVKLPADIGSHKSDLDDLTKLSGAEFDKEYVAAMVEGHEDTVELFEDKSTSSDLDIKAFTTKTLPTLKKHLETIKALQAKMK